ncbi:MAG: 2-oxo acid dehydrogenase subunit E2, partial [Pseudomonas sp.]
MGTHVIKMPDIGEGIAQVELVEWFVKVGDVIAEDQVVADVMTDKATVEIPSPVSGTVVALGGQPGEVMAVGSELIRIEVEGSGNTRPPAASKPSAEIVPRQANEKPLASPAVRKRALDAGIELRYVHGSGPAGRIQHEDLDNFMSKPQSAAGQASSGYSRRTDSEQLPVIGLRRKIAQRMQDAKRRVAHFSYVEEIDVTALEALRQQLNRKYGESRGKLTLLPLLVRAMVVALRDFPQINAT